MKTVTKRRPGPGENMETVKLVHFVHVKQMLLSTSGYCLPASHIVVSV